MNSYNILVNKGEFMSLSDYSKSFKNDDFNSDNSKYSDNLKDEYFKQSANIKDERFRQTEQQIKDKYNTLKDKNKDELMNELFDEVSKQKQDGSFDFEALKGSVDALSPFLTDVQKNNIYNLLQQIK